MNILVHLKHLQAYSSETYYILRELFWPRNNKSKIKIKPFDFFISNRFLMLSVAQVRMLPEEVGPSALFQGKNSRDTHAGGVLSNSGQV